MNIVSAILFSFFSLSFRAIFSTADTIHPRKRVVGGSFENIRDHPCVVSIRYYGLHQCGGCLYKTNVVITAGHCLAEGDKKPNEITVHAGSSFRYFPVGSTYGVKNFKVHEKYDSKKIQNDIAIIILDSKVDFDIFISLRSGPIKGGESVSTCGWGKTSGLWPFWPFSMILPFFLRCTDLEIYEYSSCKSLYSKGKVNITESMLCAHGKEKDACVGDSGGPLISTKANELVGIVSFGVGCASSKYPGIYTNISNYVIWINNTITSLQKGNTGVMKLGSD